MTDQVNEAVAWRLRNTSFRKPTFEYFDTEERAKQRQADFNRSVDDGGLHDLTPLYAHPSRGVVDGLCERLQQKCSDWGTYWRAPDAHGVSLSMDRALELLRDALGVEVEIAQAAALPAVPDGWALVPKRPTPEMLSLALSHVYGEPFWRTDAKPIGTFYSGHTAAESEQANIAECGPDRVKAAYAAMLAAAPAHDQPEEEG